MNQENHMKNTSILMMTSRLKWMQQSRWPFIIYLLAILLTDAYFMGDTDLYAQNIITGGRRLWEPGHLLWRPLGLFLWYVFGPVTSLVVGMDPHTNVILVLRAINLLAGLLAVFSLHRLLSQVNDNSWVINLVTIAFIFSQGFLNYAQSGTPYIAGLALLLLGLYLLLKSTNRASHASLISLFAGVSLASAVCLWLPYILVIPIAFVLPLFFFGVDRQRLWLLICAAVICSLIIAFTFVTVGLYLGINSPTAFGKWLTSASHGIAFGGIPRMLIGFPRSFINIGNDGILFKRFLLHDPYNSVSLFDLVRSSLWKLAMFYLFVLAIFVNLLRNRQRRQILYLALLGGLPVLAFAVYWQGGDMERYLALYPFLFVALLFSFVGNRSFVTLKYIMWFYLAVQILTNISAMSTVVLDRKQEREMVRVSELLPLLKPNSIVYTLNRQDELFQINQRSPFSPLTKRYSMFVNALGGLWPRSFAERTLKIWQAGGDVWFSKRMLHPHPHPDWHWAEGAEQTRPWADIYAFYTQLETDKSVGGEDGFVLLAPSSRNRQLLLAIAGTTTMLEEGKR
jgi:hypothetical protein